MIFGPRYAGDPSKIPESRYIDTALTLHELSSPDRFEIIFGVAVELESSVLLLSSTADGYKHRIEVVQDNIRALSSLELWDSDKQDFEASQEIIQCLRQHSCVVGKG
jgi:hypothetical protein